MTREKSLVSQLFAEVMQTERSAHRHCDIEARRLGSVPPAGPMRLVAAHATGAERSLSRLAEARGQRTSRVGTVVGSLFSMARDGIGDFALTTEQSYRGTLLGMRHGYDVLSLFGMAAREEGDTELAAWCETWRAERAPLIAATASELAWFSAHPSFALANGRLGVRAAR